MWAAKRGLKRTAWLSLAEGADIEALHIVMIPHQLRCLDFKSVTTCLTSLQIALCYGSDSVARFLIEHGAITAKSYPPELDNCTSLHMASATCLTSVVKALIDHDANVEARDKKLRTPLHYAVSMQRPDWPEQGRTVMWLLAKKANPGIEDVERRRPTSVAKQSSNPFVKMLFKKGAEVAQYEALFQDQDVLELRRLTKERNEEEAWRNERKENQRASELASRAVRKREKNREMGMQKRVAAEQKVAITKARDQKELARKRETQENTLKIARAEANRVAAARSKIEEEGRVEKAREERQNGVRENWSRLRKKAEQESQDPCRDFL